MNHFVIYLLESATCMMALTWFYWLFLNNTNHIRFNRFFILFSIIISVILPLLDFTYKVGMGSKVILYNVLDTVVINASGIETYLEHQPFEIMFIVWILWIIGVLFYSLIFITRLAKIISLIASSRKQKYGDYIVVEVPDAIAPSSFFRFIFLGKTGLPEKDMKNIVAHERIHIRQMHSMDNMLFEILCIVQWFNPFAWWMQTRSRETHEFLADREVVRQGYDRLQYQHLLVNYAVSTELLPASSFKNSLLKRRLIMLSKMEAPRKTWIKVVLMTPVIGLLVLAFSCTQKNESEVIENKVESSLTSAGEIYKEVDVLPEYEGGMQGLQTKLMGAVKYPENAKENGLTGKIYVSFVVMQDGKIENVKIVKGVADNYKLGDNPTQAQKDKYQAALDMEQAAMDAVKNLTNWTPGKKDGKTVNTELTLPINFQLQ